MLTNGLGQPVVLPRRDRSARVVLEDVDIFAGNALQAAARGTVSFIYSFIYYRHQPYCSSDNLASDPLPPFPLATTTPVTTQHLAGKKTKVK